MRLLFLQGPPGPLFLMLAERLLARGAVVHRINLSGGDQYDWSGAAHGYRGTLSDWPAFLNRFLADHEITDIVLFGDCRAYHEEARRLGALRGIDVHVLEEGYIRPNYMTFELGGVNANSSLPADPAWYLAQAITLPPIPPAPPVTASFARRARDSFWYYAHVSLRFWRFPHYHSHRSSNIFMEMFGWGWRLLRQKARRRAAARTIAELAGRSVFLFPLQLGTDFQIRRHSPFADMHSATRFVVRSFAEHAPRDACLLLKVHPLDVGSTNWGAARRRWAHEFGLGERLRLIDGGDLEALINGSVGVVSVNSTSATFALALGKPVCVVGQAMFNMRGLTHQGHVDTFWRAPAPPDPRLWEAFQRVLADCCLVRGGLASKSAVATLLDGLVERLTAPPIKDR